MNTLVQNLISVGEELRSKYVMLRKSYFDVSE